MHLKLLLWVPCLQEEQISPGTFFPQWSCCLLAGTSTQGAGWSKTSWSQQGCIHQDDEIRGNPSASFVETGACGTLTDLSVCTCLINCIHNFLSCPSILLAPTRCFWVLCATQCAFKLLVADEWARTVGLHYSKHSPAQPIIWTEELSEETREVTQTLGLKQLERVGNERCRVRAPSHAHNALTASSNLHNPPDSPQCLSFSLPSPSPSWTSFPLSILPLHFQEWLWCPSKCYFTWTAEISWANTRELGFHYEATSVFLFLTCLNLKVINVCKLPCNCIWVSPVPLIFLVWKNLW